MNINKVQVAGRLGSDPELKSLPSGVAVCNFSLASNRTWKDKNTGEKNEETEWHSIVFFGRQAEVISQYVSKGKELYVEGRLKTRSWDADGVKKYKTEIVGESFQFVGSRSSEGGQAQSSQTAQASPDIETITYDDPQTEEIRPEDIPF